MNDFQEFARYAAANKGISFGLITAQYNS